MSEPQLVILDVSQVEEGDKEQITVANGSRRHSKFPKKLWDLVNERTVMKDPSIGWMPDGMAFFIWPQKFEDNVLPGAQMFRSNQLISFIHQLHLYGFKKMNETSKGPSIYGHQNFIQGRPDLLDQITRSIDMVKVLKMPKPWTPSTAIMSASDPWLTYLDGGIGQIIDRAKLFEIGKITDEWTKRQKFSELIDEVSESL